MIEWSKVVGWALSVLLSLLFTASALFKFLATEMVAKDMPAGIAAMILVIGIGELLSAILFLVPWTATLGTLLLSSYMGGAIIVHMTKQESFVPQAVILVLIWLAGFLRGTWGFWRRTS